MSTRANIKMVDKFGDTLWFYRHTDGYPEATEKSLQIFMGWLKEGKIRRNCWQAGGWLIVLGHHEYAKYHKGKTGYPDDSDDAPEAWKVGAYEPTSDQHADVQYLYEIDLEKKTLTTIKLYE